MLYQQVILALVVLMAAVTLVNVLSFPSLRGELVPRAQPFVSVLIPARNEAATIAQTLEGLSNQEYERYEIVVLDDNSTDTTADIVRTAAARDQRIRLISGEPLPAGWTGKNFACHQLSREARGDLLLFVDADTQHGPHSIRAGVAELERSSAGLVTAIPRQRMVGFWENVVVPLLHFVTFCFLPMPLVSTTRNPKLAMANGQYMLWQRDAYRAVGGHEAVRANIVEDVWLARMVKSTGHRLAIRYGGNEVSCRMYASLRDIWNGFSKNLFPGFNYSFAMISGVVLFNLATSVIPFFLLAMGILHGGTPAAPDACIAAQVAGVLSIRLLLAYRFDMKLWPSVLHPLAIMIFVGIALNSVRWHVAGGGSRWKGRAYDFRTSISTPTVKSTQ